MRVLDHFLKAVRGATVFNPDVEVAPACILWPDADRQWERAMPVLQDELPELLILGEYAPHKRTGPAIWLRCVIAGKVADVPMPPDQTPILYLPGVARQDLRAVESCPEPLRPLCELQFRGAIWSQVNGKDWTILAYLKSVQGGLGLDVARDKDTMHAMQLALCPLLGEEISLLRGKSLDKDYFNTLLTGGDPNRDVLQWLDAEDAFRNTREENEWDAFVGICKSRLAFDPQAEGVLSGCVLLANHEGPWLAVWNRYQEAPRRYPNIPSHIRKCSLPADRVFRNTEARLCEGWPQWNDKLETRLRKDLTALADLPPHQARKRIAELEARHCERRSLVWAELGEAPLARALEHLACLAKTTQKSLAAGSVDDLATGYAEFGWLADDSVLQALARVEHKDDVDAVTTAIRAVYLPWAEESARYLQQQVAGNSYPGGTCRSTGTDVFNAGDCVFFVDGLRFDAAKRLSKALETKELVVNEKSVWAALPSVTATGKPAVSPVRDKIVGKDDGPDFEPSVADSGQSLHGGQILKKLLADAGWSILDGSTEGDGQGKAWCEFGDIDHEGHHRGWKLSVHLDALIEEIARRIVSLVDAGWKRVHVVTDHGWLLMPGGLPRIELPVVLTENKWGRCATLKCGAATEERQYPWYWNPDRNIVLADGASCFRHGMEYAHGGLSLQECLTLHLTVTQRKAVRAVSSIELTDVVWRGLRCTVAVDGDPTGLTLDIRIKAGDPQSSVVLSSRALKDDGRASVVVENEDLEGQKAMVVLMDAQGVLVAQRDTVIGGGEY